MITETVEEEMPLSELDQIKRNLQLAQEALTVTQGNCNRIKKELSKEEDKLVEANEALRTATEALREYERTKVLNIVDEDLRDIEIERLKKKLPELLKQIENEKPIVLKDAMMSEDDEEELG